MENPIPNKPDETFSRRNERLGLTEEEISELNEQLREGESIVDLTDKLRRIHNPVFVDLNNVLINNEEPFIANPDAIQALQILRETGTVIVLTTSNKWNIVHGALAEQGLLSDDMVIIAAPNYVDLMSQDFIEEDTIALRNEWESMAIDNNLLSEDQIAQAQKDSTAFWSGARAAKKVAFAFMKPYNIPLIDDTYLATTDNPGVLGIPVTPWNNLTERNDLLAAAEAAQEHYRSL